ncbi:hypothetical protein ACR6C2_05020 [Streptomyces sp. INA 01156]
MSIHDCPNLVLEPGHASRRKAIIEDAPLTLVFLAVLSQKRLTNDLESACVTVVHHHALAS